jgi:alkanesulfonate monooxygenase SsuD/methylene tetrahydromethanopterin reductase-like flavin-dependent oxidoreductase (luciferase family)
VLLTRLGAMFEASRPVRELPELAQRVEALGLDELWMAEDCVLHDGVLLPEAAGPGAVAWVRETLGPNGHIVVYSWLRVDDDADRAREVVRALVRTRRDGGMYPNLVRLGCLPDEREIDDGAVDRVAIAGTPEQCAGAIARLAAAGASTVVVVPVGGGAAEKLEQLSADVAPLLERA